MKQYFQKIAFIGGGNMGSAIIAGLIAEGFPKNQLIVSEPNNNNRNKLEQQFGILTCDNNCKAIEFAEIVVLAVKPQAIPLVIQEITESIKIKLPLIISIVAGTTVATYESNFGKQIPIIRCMPNTPALLGAGISALYANAAVSELDREQSACLFSSVGKVVWLEHEEQMNIVTALSGSGPAYFFLFMQALKEAAIQQGLPDQIAHQLTLQTAYGAARMAQESGKDLNSLRIQVTSPGGTTEAALKTLEKNYFEKIVAQAIDAAVNRSKELSTITS